MNCSTRIRPATTGPSPKTARTSVVRPAPTKPGDAQDLAAPEHQARGSRRLPDAKLVELEDRLAGRMRHAGKELVQVAADHVSDDRLQVRFRQSPAGDRSTVSQHGVGLGDPAHFLEKMADINDGQPAAAEPLDDRE